jgi:GT2 family glycosyltransferase
MNSKVIIILINYRNSADTLECVTSILKSSYSDFYVFVVDNSDSDASFLELQSGFYSFTNCTSYSQTQFEETGFSTLVEESRSICLVQATTNGGFAFANNIILKKIIESDEKSYVFVLNNDTIIDSNCIKILVENINDTTGILSPIIYYYKQPNLIWSAGGFYNKFTGLSRHYLMNKQEYKPSARKNSFLTGCAWFFSSDRLREVGILKEDFFMYFEDLEYSQRFYNRKLALSVEPRSKIWHKIGSSSGDQSLSYFSSFWMAKSRLFYYINFTKGVFRIASITFYLVSRIFTITKYACMRRFDIARAQYRGIIAALK